MGQGSYTQLAAAGIQFDMIVTGGSSISGDIANLNAFEAAEPGSIIAVEGPNEVDITPFSYDGLSGLAAAIQYESDLYDATESDSALSGIPVYNLTDISAGVAAPSTVANVHSYSLRGAEPLQTLIANTAMAETASPGKPLVLTEGGYSSMPSNIDMGGVDAATQAKLTLNMIMDAAKLGYQDIFLYELLDETTTTKDTNYQDYFGLFSMTNAPKPVAAAIHDLTSILADTGANASTFKTGSLNYTLTGLPSTGESLLMEKSSGVFDLIVWNEPKIWNSTTETEVAAPATTVTVKLGAVYGTVDVYDPLTGVTPISAAHNVSQIQISLTDHPLIIQVSTASSIPAIANTPLTVTGPHILYGGTAGGSTLNDDVGATTMSSGGGGNTYIVSNSNDVILQGSSTVENTVVSTVSFTMPANIGLMELKGTGNLTATANNGVCTIFANSGNDTLNGGTGPDTFFLSTGQTTINAVGESRFVFQSLADTGALAHPDVINGFVAAHDDIIDLSGIASSLAGGSKTATFIGNHAFEHVAGELNYSVTSAGLLLSGDTTGAGVADFSILLTHVTSISAQNILW